MPPFVMVWGSAVQSVDQALKESEVDSSLLLAMASRLQDLGAQVSRLISLLRMFEFGMNISLRD